MKVQLLSAAFAAMFALVPTASALCLTPNCAPRRPAPNCARAPVHAVRAQLGGGGLGALWDGLMGGAPTEYTPLEERETSTEELEYVPLVLVVGATGRTGFRATSSISTPTSKCSAHWKKWSTHSMTGRRPS